MLLLEPEVFFNAPTRKITSDDLLDILFAFHRFVGDQHHWGFHQPIDQQQPQGMTVRCDAHIQVGDIAGSVNSFKLYVYLDLPFIESRNVAAFQLLPL